MKSARAPAMTRRRLDEPPLVGEHAWASEPIPRERTAGNDSRTVEQLLTLREVAALLQLSDKTLRRLVAARRLPCVRLGRQLRFAQSDIVRWVSARKCGGGS